MNEEKRALLEKIFGVPARLRIMSALVVRKEMDFTEMVNTLNLTRGNLSMHMKTLGEQEYIEVQKAFVKNKPKTTYKATILGRQDFSMYVEMLENILSGLKTGEIENAQ